MIGGYTGDGFAYASIAGIVHKGEYVFSAPAVDRIGVDNLEGDAPKREGWRGCGWVKWATRKYPPGFCSQYETGRD